MDVFYIFKMKIESHNLEHWYMKDQWPYLNQNQDSKPQSGTSIPHQSPKSWLKGRRCSLHLQNEDRNSKFECWLYQRPGTISKSTSRCQTPVRNLEHPLKSHIRTLRTWSKDLPKTSDHIKINIRMPNPSQEPPASSKAPNQDLKDMDVLCTFKIKLDGQNWENGCTKDQWPYPNQYQDA